MIIEELLKFEDITIQCHDNPDADAIASGYGLYCFLTSKGKKVRLMYSGRNVVRKSNLRLMIDRLGIPVTYISAELADEFDTGDLLITVDCQYGAGNVTKFRAKNVAIIDHHQIEITDVPMSHIVPGIGSCATIVWKLLTEAGYEVTDDNGLGTALYYGLVTDTNHFTEMSSPIDRDAQDQLPHRDSLINLFINSNISMEELEIAGKAMLHYRYNEEYDFALIRTQPCDPNILGLISDFLLQVDQIHSCVVYNETLVGYKLSVRSCIREVNASELAAFLTDGIGSGGGHYCKAGGFISKKKYSELYDDECTEQFFHDKIVDYFDNYELIYADDYVADIDSMKLYQKNSIPVGCVRATDIWDIGTPVTIRTIEGDVDMKVDEDLIIIIGIKGEVYPNRFEKFNRSYKIIDDTYDFHKCVVNDEYEPVVINRTDGSKQNLTKYARTCVSTGNVQIYAKPLTKAVKVFTAWDKDKYMVGKKGDYLAVRNDDLHDVYVVEKKIFARTYSEIQEKINE